MWRPANWKKIKKDEVPHLMRFDGKYDAYISGYESGIEAGADGMLKALLNDKTATRINVPTCANTIIFPPEAKGVVTFIPDETP